MRCESRQLHCLASGFICQHGHTLPGTVAAAIYRFPGNAFLTETRSDYWGAAVVKVHSTIVSSHAQFVLQCVSLHSPSRDC